MAQEDRPQYDPWYLKIVESSVGLALHKRFGSLNQYTPEQIALACDDLQAGDSARTCALGIFGAQPDSQGQPAFSLPADAARPTRPRAYFFGENYAMNDSIGLSVGSDTFHLNPLFQSDHSCHGHGFGSFGDSADCGGDGGGGD